MAEPRNGDPYHAAPGLGLQRKFAMADPFRWIAAVDLGGTHLRTGMVPFAGGDPSEVRTAPTRPELGPASAVDRIAAMVRDSWAGLNGGETDPAGGAGVAGGVAGIGIASPGPLDRTSGTVLESPNLGWKNVPLRDLVSEATGLPATLDNDANCAAYGEWWLGAGRLADRLICLTLGTGIGGGMILDGEVYRGASGAAGEVGHMSVDFAGRRCACGSLGCVEAYAAGPGIAARAVEGIEEGAVSSLTELAGRDPARITAEMVCEAADAGDRYANQVLLETARILGVAVANLVNLFNPDVIVMTGGVTRAGERLFQPLRREVGRRAFRSAFQACRILSAQRPETAGLVGAAGIFARTTFGRH